MDAPDLAHYVRTYEASLEPELCAQLVSSFESLQRFQMGNGRGHRAGLEESAWTELNVSRMADEPFRQMFRSRINRALADYNRDVALPVPIPNSPLTSDLILKRYRPSGEERFQLHFDAINHVANRYLVLLWYLNDVEQGGETRFPTLGRSIAPRTGRLIVFPPYWMYPHEGVAPVSGVKYILSTYLLFGAAPVP